MDTEEEQKELLNAIKHAATLFTEMHYGDIHIIKSSGRHANYFEKLAQKYDAEFVAGYDVEEDDEEEYTQDAHSLEIVDQPESGGP